MFNKPFEITGKHARIIKTYSPDNTAKDRIVFSKPDIRNKQIEFNIFGTFIYCYTLAAMVGIVEGRKAEVDKSEKYEVTIFLDIIQNYSSLLKRIVHFMILCHHNDLTVDGRIKKAFKSEQDDEIELEFHAYARGGLEIIDEYFQECQTAEDVIYHLYSFINDFSLDFDDEADEDYE